MMDTLHAGEQKTSGLACPAPNASDLTRGFNVSVLVSGVRCTLSYVVLPFLVPVLGFAPGVGPALGLLIGVVAIAANAWSFRRFWKTTHPWRPAALAVHALIIVFLAVLIVIDLGSLTGLTG
jgi:hypothetical protein